MTSEKILLDAGASPRGWSMRSQWMRCPRRAALLEAGYRGDDRDALLRGSTFHVGIAHHYARIQYAQMGLDIDRLYSSDEAMIEYARRNPECAPFLQVCHDAMEAYEVEHAVDRPKVFAVEHLVDIAVEGPTTGKTYRHTMRIDLMTTDASGRIWAWDHKCEPASTRVMTPDGPRTVGDLFVEARPWTCAAWTGVESAWEGAAAPVYAGEQDVYRVRLSDGTVEDHGYNHPILTELGWERVVDLREGNWVAVAQPPEPEVPCSLDDGQIWVGALALSDGSRSTGGCYRITAHASAVRAQLAGYLETDSWAVATYRGRHVGVRLHEGGRVVSWLRRSGIAGSLAPCKAFPAEFYRLTKRQAGIALGGFWSGDGSVCFGTPRKGSRTKPVRIVYSSRSRALVEGVRHLLSQLGIASNFCATTAKNTPYFQAVVVGRPSKLAFLRMVVDGQIPCDDARQGGRRSRRGRVLESAAELLEALDGTRTHGGRIQCPQFERGVRWVRVESIESMGVQPCYDIEVPGSHTFCTHTGLVTHNTAAKIDSRKRPGFELSGQVIGITWWGRKVYGDRWGGFVINMVEWRPGGANFLRFLPRVAPFAISQFPRTIEYTEELYLFLVERYGTNPDDWPMVLQEQGPCMDRYGACEFRYMCRWGTGVLGRDV